MFVIINTIAMLIPINNALKLSPKQLELQIKVRQSLVYNQKHGKFYTDLIEDEIKKLSDRHKFLTGEEVFI